jgi:hypothetical protein
MDQHNTHPPRSESSFKIYAMSRIRVDISVISTKKKEIDYSNDIGILRVW